MLAYILAAACHDLDHKGYSNVYLIETKDKLAIRYNDQSVLENHHVATAFDILSQNEYDIFAKLCKKDYKRIRKLMIGAILATDMAKHFDRLSIIKQRFLSEDLDPTKDDEKMLICEALFHFADISNPTKTFDLCEKWTELLFVEFFEQGDSERSLGLPISQFMDRSTTNIAKS